MMGFGRKPREVEDGDDCMIMDPFAGVMRYDQKVPSFGQAY